MRVMEKEASADLL